jgi:hypothetical protein
MNLVVTEWQAVRGIAAAQDGAVSVSRDPGLASGEQR